MRASSASTVRRVAALFLCAALLGAMPPLAFSADSVIATIGTGTQPNAVAVNPVSHRVYVANSGSDNVTIVDGSTNTTAATVAFPTGTFCYANCVVVDPIASPAKAYVGHFWRGTTNVISETSAAVVGTMTGGVAHGGGPRALALDPSSTPPKLYVAEYGVARIDVFNATSTALITRIGVGASPRALAIFTSTGRRRIFCANGSSASVTVIDAATDSGVATLAVGASPKAIAVDPATGIAYVTTEDSNQVFAIGTSDSIAGSVTVGARPRGIGVDSGLGRIFVANYDAGTVSVVSTSTLSVVATLTVGTNPRSVAVDQSEHKVYVSNYASDNVSIITSDLAVTTVAAGDGPYGVAVDEGLPAHQAYVSNNQGNTLSVIDEPVGGSSPARPAVLGPFRGRASAEPLPPIAISIDPLSRDTWFGASPVLTGTAVSQRLFPAAVVSVMARIDGGAWQRATITAGAGTPSVAWSFACGPLAVGSHTVEAIAFDETGAASAAAEYGAAMQLTSYAAGAPYAFDVSSASLSTPTPVGRPRANRAFRVTGTLSPKHRPRGTVIHVTATSDADPPVVKTYHAYLSERANHTIYSAYPKLGRGRWTLQATHVDLAHDLTSATKVITIK
jgi:YVTN family beta-propeller protein